MCSRDQRSRLAALLMPLFSSGILTAFLVGGYLPWNVASASYTGVCTIGLICSVVWTPESPCWLVNEGRYEEAKRSLRYLRGSDSTNIEAHVEVLKMSRKSVLVERNAVFSDLLEPTVWKPFVILVLFHFLQTGTGFYGLMYYTVDFFDDLRTSFDPLTVTIFLSVARLVMSCVFGTYCATRLNRKVVTALSSGLSGVSLLGAAAYEHVFTSIDADERLHTWIPIGCILTNVLVCTITVQPLPWLMTRELFPLPVRGIMCGLTYFIGTVLVFLSVKYFMSVMGLFGIPGALSFFSASSFLVCLFGIFVLPDTNNKNRSEIERNFTKAKPRVEEQPLIGKGVGNVMPTLLV
nr:PREDICTED: facilitated trehalose transporter Tret1-like [Bemisia tabaci]